MLNVIPQKKIHNYNYYKLLRFYYESKGFSWVASSFRSAGNIDHWAVQMLNGQSNLGSILFSPRYMDPGNLVPAAGRAWQLDSSN